jgi:hypothetical protein
MSSSSHYKCVLTTSFKIREIDKTKIENSLKEVGTWLDEYGRTATSEEVDDKRAGTLLLVI